ncbi:MAG: hypothetical protein H6Q73_2246 [Firmicutes bacterium]|nr:hypothetical protein [Bacillota bacterium]
MFVYEEEKSTMKNLVTRGNLVMLVSSVVLAAGYDVLIAQPFAAISYPVFIIALLAIVYGNTRPLLVKEQSIGWFLVFPLIALALTRLLFTNEILCFLNSMVIPVLFVAHILVVTKSSRHEWFHSGFLKDVFGGLIIRPLQFVAKPFFLMWALARQESEVATRSVFRKVILGLVFSLPILVVVVILLSSADPVFEVLVRAILSNINIVEITKHSLMVGLITMVVFSFIWGLNNNRVEQVSYDAGAKNLDEIIVITALSVLSAVYLLFSVIQFSYLFGGFSDLLPSGLTYAAYARRGFFELVAVVLINTGIVVGNVTLTVTSRRRLAIILKGLNSVLLLSTFVMLLSAHYRMSLYEESYGYTYLRVFTHGFMGMVFVMLCATIYKVWVDRINLAKWYVMIGLIAYVLINYVNVDTFIANKNMERFYRTGVIDVDYMAGLSYDVLPCLVALTQEPDRNIELAARIHIANKQDQLSVNRNWQGFNLSEQRARNILWRIY